MGAGTGPKRKFQPASPRPKTSSPTTYAKAPSPKVLKSFTPLRGNRASTPGEPGDAYIVLMRYSDNASCWLEHADTAKLHIILFGHDGRPKLDFDFRRNCSAYLQLESEAAKAAAKATPSDASLAQRANLLPVDIDELRQMGIDFQGGL